VTWNKTYFLRATPRSSEQEATLAFVGNWEWDLVTGAVTWSDGLYRLLGLEPGTVSASTDLFATRLHPEDREAAEAASDPAGINGQTIDNEFRVIRPSGEVRWLANKGEVFFDAGGHRSWAAGALFDITELRRAQLTLADREERYRALATVHSVCQWRVSPSGEMIESSVWTEIEDAAEGTSAYDWLDTVHPDDRDFAREIWTEALRVGSTTTFSYRLLQQEGGYRWVMCKAVPLRNTDGSVREWVGSTEDIQDIRDAEERLRANESRLRLALEAGRITTWDYELRTGAIHRSENVIEVMGFTSKSFEELERLVHPEDREKVTDALRITRQTGAPLDVVYRVPQADGALRWVRSRGRLLRTGRHEPERIVGITWDVTDAMRAEVAQRETMAVMAHLRALTSITGDFTWSASPDGNIIDSEGWCRFTGQDAKAAECWGWLRAVHPADRERAREALQSLLDGSSVQSIEYRLRDRTGGYQWVRSRAAPLTRPDRGVEWVGVCQVIQANRSDAGSVGETTSFQMDAPRLISGVQVRAARGLLRWSVRDLAEASGVSASSIKRIEEEDGVPEGRDVRSLQAIRSALEAVGIELNQSPNGMGTVGFRAPVAASAIRPVRTVA
jgi:PAS domain S-box-containing protein